MSAKRKSYARENSRLVKQFKEMTVQDIYSMDGDSARFLLERMRVQYERRAATHERAASKNQYGFNLKPDQSRMYYSNAYENIKASYEKNPMKDVDSMRIEQVKAELSRLNSFYNSAGSTVTGARKISRDQDVRIFGADEKGRPNFTMNAEQRNAFWRVYEEAARSPGMAAMVARMYSLEKNGQEILGEIIKISPNDLNFESLYSRYTTVMGQYERLNNGWRIDKKELDPVIPRLHGDRDDWERLFS